MSVALVVIRERFFVWKSVAFRSVARDALQSYAEYFKYKVYFCKGDTAMRDFIFTTR